MGREVRRVPANWQHPTKDDWSYIPLLEGDFRKDADYWDIGLDLWLHGSMEVWSKELDRLKTVPHNRPRTIWEWIKHGGLRPLQEDYMPEWTAEQRTHWQMYENVSEGTPISPPMESPEALAHWLANNNAGANAGDTATYEQWLATILRGFAFSMMEFPGSNGLVSGVEGMARMEQEEGNNGN